MVLKRCLRQLIQHALQETSVLQDNPAFPVKLEAQLAHQVIRPQWVNRSTYVSIRSW